MIVCSCFGITDREIRASMRADREAMAGTCCGSCLPVVADIVREAGEQERAAPDRRRDVEPDGKQNDAA